MCLDGFLKTTLNTCLPLLWAIRHLRIKSHNVSTQFKLKLLQLINTRGEVSLKFSPAQDKINEKELIPKGSLTASCALASSRSNHHLNLSVSNFLAKIRFLSRQTCANFELHRKMSWRGVGRNMYRAVVNWAFGLRKFPVVFSYTNGSEVIGF